MPGPALVTDRQSSVIRFARARLGIALVYRQAVASDLRRGDLVEIFAGRAVPLPHFRLCYASKRHMAPDVRAFIDLAKGWAKKREGRKIGQ